MKIIILSAHHIEDDRVKRHVLYCEKEGYDVYYLHYNITHPGLAAGPFSIAGEKGYRINCVKGGNLTTKLYMIGRSAFRETVTALDKLGVPGDERIIMHAHDPENLFIASRLLKKRMTKAKIIYDRHEYYELLKGMMGLHTLYWIEKLFRKIVHGVVMVSEGQAAVTSRLFPAVQRVTVPNFPYYDNYDHERIKQKIRRISDDTEFTMVYIGSFYRDFDRDTDLLLSVTESILAKHRNCRFILAGDCRDGTILAEIERLSSEFGDRFQYLGFIARSEAARITEEAHIGFFLLKPSFWERCSPNKIFEYLICGVIPVIKANIDYREKLGETGLVFGEDDGLEKITGAIADILNNPLMVIDRMNASYEMSKEFTWDRAAERYKELYGKLL